MTRGYGTDRRMADIIREFDDHDVFVENGTIITVWWDMERYQDIEWSQFAEDMIREGADPVADGWEDGAGYKVCIENSTEA